MVPWRDFCNRGAFLRKDPSAVGLISGYLTEYRSEINQPAKPLHLLPDGRQGGDGISTHPDEADSGGACLDPSSPALPSNSYRDTPALGRAPACGRSRDSGWMVRAASMSFGRMNCIHVVSARLER